MNKCKTSKEIIHSIRLWTPVTEQLNIIINLYQSDYISYTLYILALYVHCTSIFVAGIQYCTQGNTQRIGCSQESFQY